MIVDAHVHVFPDQGGQELGRPAAEQRAMMQACVAEFWGRMVTSHSDRRFIPEPGEDVDFQIGAFGRWTWRKHGENCWLQRGTPMMTRMEHSPEQMIATMDTAGVSCGVIQTDIEYVAAALGRERYFKDCIERFPDRLIGAVALDFNLDRDDAALAREVAALTTARSEGFRAVYLSGVGLPEPMDHERCDALWEEITRLELPVYAQTGFCTVARYRDQLRGLGAVMRRYPELRVIDSHLGGNLVHPSLPGHTDVLEDLGPLLETGRFYLEAGYVLGFENVALWGDAAFYPFTGHDEIIRQVYERYGAGALVWGSDVPWCYRVCTYGQAVDLVRRHTPYMSDADRDAVLGGNMAQLLSL